MNVKQELLNGAKINSTQNILFPPFKNLCTPSHCGIRIEKPQTQSFIPFPFNILWV